MTLLEKIQKATSEFREQARKVADTYGGGGSLYYCMSMLWCYLRYGARPIDYVRFEYYKKNSHERNRYLTWGRYMRMKPVFGMYNEATHGKVAEYKTFASYIHRPWMVADLNTEPQAIRDFISEQGVVFAKPNFGDQGKGVLKIKAEDKAAVEELLAVCKKGAFVVDGAIQNAPEIAAINSSSVNTVRVYTLLKKDGVTEILGIMLRVGRKGSHVDNWGSGGVGYDFDVETGVCVGYGRDKKNNPYIFHPDSNVQMVGYRLPDFVKLKKTVIELSHIVPDARFVGWDIAITPNGYDLVEMNCPGGHDFLQAFGKPFGDVLIQELK